MLIDHIGAIFFPSELWIRAIGRLSMPLFAYSLAIGFRYCNLNNKLENYIKKLSIFTLISQLPFSLAFNTSSFNIGFTWCIAFLVLLIYTRFSKTTLQKILFPLIPLIFLFFLRDIIKFDYFIYGAIMPLFMYITYVENKIKEKYLFLIMILLFGFFLYLKGASISSYIQGFSVFAIPIISICNKSSIKINLNKNFYYIFYPAHLLVLYLIHLL